MALDVRHVVPVGLFMHPFGSCYASVLKHLIGEYLIGEYSVLVQILLNHFNLIFRRL